MLLVDINQGASSQEMFVPSRDLLRQDPHSSKSGGEESIKLYIWVHPVTMRDKRLYFHLHGLLGFIWQIQ